MQHYILEREVEGKIASNRKKVSALYVLYLQRNVISAEK